ncbi:adenylate kinase [Candidatus Uhrbacteria bacterium RIFCSPHIGHO2_02_FULL_60_10]|uniref:Adenylate kinase n=1 Tax=Candidatus Uhrbacteria bacterium RIFCSPHIGHO2_02_FULL_60_10 TaxID=1802392 RepID=A0A1F7U5B1_9BACT|nr:MAG: adenylate kinase [Candidatus Uhrbacteria bacterium RIFCSPHIGHO2_02_FULL_60_10]
MNIVFLGPQGAGKGTQAEKLSELLEIPTVSVGKLFRAEIERETGLGRAIAKYVEAGERVPPDMTDQIIGERLSEEDTADGVIMDGYPRTQDQIAQLDKVFAAAGRKVTHVLYLTVPDDVSVRRLAGRRVCSNLKCEENYHVDFNPPKKDPDYCDKCGSPLIQRSGDTVDAIKKRLELYHRDTEPIVDYYRRQGLLHEIDGNRPIDVIEKDIKEIFSA